MSSPSRRSSSLPFTSYHGVLAAAHLRADGFLALVLGDNLAAQGTIHSLRSRLSCLARHTLSRWLQLRLIALRGYLTGLPIAVAKCPGSSANPADRYARLPVLAEADLAPLPPSSALGCFPLFACFAHTSGQDPSGLAAEPACRPPGVVLCSLCFTSLSPYHGFKGACLRHYVIVRAIPQGGRCYHHTFLQEPSMTVCPCSPCSLPCLLSACCLACCLGCCLPLPCHSSASTVRRRSI